MREIFLDDTQIDALFDAIYDYLDGDISRDAMFLKVDDICGEKLNREVVKFVGRGRGNRSLLHTINGDWKKIIQYCKKGLSSKDIVMELRRKDLLEGYGVFFILAFCYFGNVYLYWLAPFRLGYILTRIVFYLAVYFLIKVLLATYLFFRKYRELNRA